ncbi:alpha/beta hydrolase [Micromonospora sp. NPDC006766]|uniref:alpha/beta fold hydrolase n=1 Tax=Micromonospora sp. NPDC006766 TaxID=3154778 RepID=UPI00340172B4
MTHIEANGITMHVQVLEPPGVAARTAVLVHGLGHDSMASWYLTLAHPLCAQGVRVVLYDLRGHGMSEAPRSGYRLADFIGDLEALLAHLDVDGPILLLGNSFGAMVCFGYTAVHPARVAGMVAIEGGPPTAGWIGGVLAAMRANEHELPGFASSEPVSVASITCPVLCVYGGASPVAAYAHTVRRWIPQAELAVVPDATHTVLIDQPDGVRALIASFLTTLEAPQCDA